MPLPLQLIFLIVNTIIPDPIPILDEVIMYGSFFKKLFTVARWVERIDEFRDWYSNNKAKGRCIVVAGVILLCILLKAIF